MAFDYVATKNVILSHASASGWFVDVAGSEPKNSPPPGTMIFAMVLASVRSAGSGLAATSMRIEWSARVYTLPMADPQDSAEAAEVSALLDFMARVSADLTLGGNVRMVDLNGAHGEPLGAQTGYGEVNGVKLNIVQITVPVIVNDVVPQGA